jgi:predicted phage tail protein
MIAALEASGDFTQEELDQAEAALAEMFPEDGTGKRAVSGTVSKEIGDFFAGLFGSVVGKSALNTGLGKNVDGTEKTKRDELIARAGAGGLLKPFLTSAGSSVALGGILAGLSKIFGGGDQAAPAKREELIARAGAGGLLKPFLTSAGSSVALGGILAGLSKIFGGGDAPAAKRAVEDLATMFAQIENRYVFCILLASCPRS